jgi:hypothetical protein
MPLLLDLWCAANAKGGVAKAEVECWNKAALFGKGMALEATTDTVHTRDKDIQPLSCIQCFDFPS